MRILPSLLIVAINAHTTALNRREAHAYLSRARRANSFLEEMKDGNLNRECFDETCDQHENYEVYDNQEAHRESWSKLVACRDKLSDERRLSKSALKQCYNGDTRKLMNPK